MSDCNHKMKKSKIGIVTVWRCTSCKCLFTKQDDGTFKPFKILVTHPTP